MTALLASTQPDPVPAAKGWHPRLIAKVVVLTPLWVLIYTKFAAQTFFGSQPPSVFFGLTAGDLMIVLAMFWMLIGVYALWHAKSLFVELVAYLAFTVPAMFAVILGPAIVLIVQNLG